MEWKPSKLIREQLEERRLEAGRLLKEGQLSQSHAAGFLTHRWTLERIAALIKQEFGVRYHPHYLYVRNGIQNFAEIYIPIKKNPSVNCSGL